MMMLTILSSCGKTTESDQNDDPSGKSGELVEAATIVLENAYTATDIPIESNNRGYMDAIAANGRIYYQASEPVTVTNDDGTSEDIGYFNRIVSIDADGTQTTLWEKENVYPDYDQDIIEYENMYAFAVDGNDSLWTFTTHERYNQKDGYSESTVILTKYAPDGTELVSSDISNVAGEGYFYPYNVCFNGEGDLVTYSEQTVYVFDGETVEFDFKIQEQGYINSITSTNTGDVVILVQPQMEYEIKTIDFEAKRAGPVVTYTGNIYFNTVAAGSGDYSFYVMQNDYIYGFKLDTMTAEVVVNFTNSDFDSTNISRISSVSNGDFIVASHNWTNNESTITRLTPNPNAVIEGKVLITIGATYLDSATRATIRQFNRNSETARVSVIDYSQYETVDNYGAGIARLDMDILSGNAPDIICFSQLQPAKYATKGILEDMLPYIEGDTDINIDNLFGNILDAGMYDGKLYRLITGFSISTLVGKKSIVGEAGSFTAAKANEVMAKYPGSELLPMTTASNWLSNCISMSLGDYVNWTTGQCSFNTPEFVELLNSSKHFPADIDYSAIYQDYQEYERNLETMFRENRALLQNSGLNRVREIRSTMESFGEEISFVGYPTAGGGGALIYPNQDYGISAASKFKDEAWSFIKMFLTGEVDAEDRWSQSISRAAFEKQAADEMIPLAERDFSKGVEIVEFYAGGGASMWMVNSLSEINLSDYPNYELTQKEVDTARSVIESATRVYASDETISKIISEEIEAFIRGAKSAEDVAQIIQSRVSIYVSESM